MSGDLQVRKRKGKLKKKSDVALGELSDSETQIQTETLYSTRGKQKVEKGYSERGAWSFLSLLLFIIFISVLAFVVGLIVLELKAQNRLGQEGNVTLTAEKVSTKKDILTEDTKGGEMYQEEVKGKGHEHDEGGIPEQSVSRSMPSVKDEVPVVEEVKQNSETHPDALSKVGSRDSKVRVSSGKERQPEEPSLQFGNDRTTERGALKEQKVDYPKEKKPEAVMKDKIQVMEEQKHDIFSEALHSKDEEKLSTDTIQQPDTSKPEPGKVAKEGVKEPLSSDDGTSKKEVPAAKETLTKEAPDAGTSAGSYQEPLKVDTLKALSPDNTEHSKEEVPQKTSPQTAAEIRQLYYEVESLVESIVIRDPSNSMIRQLHPHIEGVLQDMETNIKEGIGESLAHIKKILLDIDERLRKEEEKDQSTLEKTSSAGMDADRHEGKRKSSDLPLESGKKQSLDKPSSDVDGKTKTVFEKEKDSKLKISEKLEEEILSVEDINKAEAEALKEKREQEEALERKVKESSESKVDEMVPVDEVVPEPVYIAPREDQDTSGSVLSERKEKAVHPKATVPTPVKPDADKEDKIEAAKQHTTTSGTVMPDVATAGGLSGSKGDASMHRVQFSHVKDATEKTDLNQKCSEGEKLKTKVKAVDYSGRDPVNEVVPPPVYIAPREDGEEGQEEPKATGEKDQAGDGAPESPSKVSGKDVRPAPASKQSVPTKTQPDITHSVSMSVSEDVHEHRKADNNDPELLVKKDLKPENLATLPVKEAASAEKQQPSDSLTSEHTISTKIETSEAVKDATVKPQKKHGGSETAEQRKVDQDAEGTKTLEDLHVQLAKAEKLLKKNPQSALDGYTAILRMHPSSAQAMIGRANSLNQLAAIKKSNSLLEEAISLYQSVLAMAEQKLLNVSDEVYRQTGLTCVERMSFRGFHGKAARVLQQLIQRYPDDLEIRNKLGVIFLLMHQTTAAQEVFETVLTRWPDDGFAQVHLGFILKTIHGDYSESVKLLQKGISSGADGTTDGRFYFHLGDALQRTGEKDKAYQVYDDGVAKGLFMSRYQRSLYNVERLTSRPFWTPEQTTYQEFFRKLEKNWQKIRDEGLAILNEGDNFQLESENLRDTGEWKQFELFTRGRKLPPNCAKAPFTCSLIENFAPAAGCRRGQIKFSVMQPHTHVWPHTGPTNCRLRAHLGLVVPLGLTMRVADHEITWKEGKIFVFDDSWEHEVWHNGSTIRLVFIVDVWHPELTEHERRVLPAI